MFKASNTNYFKPPVGAEIKRDHPLASGLVSCFLFNEDGGNIAYDINQYTKGILQPGVTWVNSKYGPGVAVGIAGNNTQYVQASNKYTLAGQKTFTIAALVQTTATSVAGGRAIYCERGSSGNDILKLDSLGTGGTNNLFFTYRNDGNTLTQVFGTKVINDGKDHLLVAVRDPWGIFVYVDGILDNSGSRTGGDDLTDATLDTRIGGDKGDSTSFWQGTVTFVYTWNRALTSSAIKWLYRESYAFIKVPSYKRYFFFETQVAGGGFPEWPILRGKSNFWGPQYS